MKSLPIFSLVVLLMISLCSCNNTTNDATSSFDGALSKNFQLESSGSEIFTNEETQDAADAVIHYFSEGFPSCTMTKLRYVDPFSSNETDNWAADYGADKGMVFFSDFTVGDATNTTLNPNSTYKDWQWYVIQTDAGDWSVVNQGQG